MTELTDDQVRALLDEITREVICGELDKALAGFVNPKEVAYATA